MHKRKGQVSILVLQSPHAERTSFPDSRSDPPTKLDRERLDSDDQRRCSDEESGDMHVD